jgi:hypothetical protein
MYGLGRRAMAYKARTRYASTFSSSSSLVRAEAMQPEARTPEPARTRGDDWLSRDTW